MAQKLPIKNLSLPVVSAGLSWHFQASPLGAIEINPLFAVLSHNTVDIQRPRDKDIGVLQLSHGSQHPPLKAVVVVCLTDWAFHSPPTRISAAA